MTSRGGHFAYTINIDGESANGRPSDWVWFAINTRIVLSSANLDIPKIGSDYLGSSPSSPSTEI